MSTIEIDSAGMAALTDFVRDRVGGGLSGRMVGDARAGAPIESGALKATGRVIRLGPELWRIIFGEGLPDGRAVYQEVGTGSSFAHPSEVDTDFSPLWTKKLHRGVPPVAYIRHAVYQERTL